MTVVLVLCAGSGINGDPLLAEDLLIFKSTGLIIYV